MFKYYMGLAIMCSFFAILAIFFSEAAIVLATIFLGMAGGFMAISFVTSNRSSRW